MVHTLTFEIVKMSGRGRDLTLPAWMTGASHQSTSLAVEISPKNIEGVDANLVQTPPEHAVVNYHVPIAKIVPSLPSIVSAPFPVQFPVYPVSYYPQINVPLPLPPTTPLLKTSIGDPNNDASCWSDYLSDDGRKFWFNRVSQISTFDKPLCLKSPEERSIPPCIWKEYSADGKKYYSNGTESSWIMPEEFRLWKEKVDAAERKKFGKENSVLSTKATLTETASKEHLNKTKTTNTTDRLAASEITSNANLASFTQGEDGFKEMLLAKNISATAKMKEVQEICEHDPRWNAVKTQGCRKQCLAEYQTKQLKLEKEVQKIKARKNRDAFLLLLAENTEIDARTRWRDAAVTLQDDIRFKNIEDAREREDLFKDFILELEKREREDVSKLRTKALSTFGSILDNLVVQNKLSRRSVWGEVRTLLSDILTNADMRVLNEVDFRKCFQDVVSQLEEDYRRNERKKKEEFDRVVAAKQMEFQKDLDLLIYDGILTPDMRWKDLIRSVPHLLSSESYKAICALLPDSSVDQAESIARDVFERQLVKAQNDFKADSDLVKEILHNVKVKVSHDSKYDDLKALVMRIGNMKEVVDSHGRCTIVVDKLFAEDGEELEDIPCANISESSSSNSAHIPIQLRVLMRERPASLQWIFNELQSIAASDYAEELRQLRKAEDRFMILLRETFYSSDHIGITWDDARKILQKRSAYDLVGKSDKKRLFTSYMESLATKMEAKSKLMKIKKADVEDDARIIFSPAMNTTEEKNHATGDDNHDNNPKRRKSDYNQDDAEGLYDNNSFGKRFRCD